MEALQGRLTGIAVPKFVVDTPGGKGKVPLLPDWVVRRGDGVHYVETFRGEIVDYVDPPACKRRAEWPWQAGLTWLS